MWALSTFAVFTSSFLGLAGLAHWLYRRLGSWVVRLHGARRLHFEEAPRLHELVAHLSIAARIPCPPVYVARSPRPNAFCVGLSPGSARLILTSAALEELDETGLCALVAHEIAHIAHGHARRATLVGVLATVARRMGAPRRLLAWLHGLGTPAERDVVADRTAAGLLGDTLGLAALLTRLKERAGPEALRDMGASFTDLTAGEASRAALDVRIHRLRKLAAQEQALRARAVLRRSGPRGSRFRPRVGTPRRRMLVHPLPGKRLTRLAHPEPASSSLDRHAHDSRPGDGGGRHRPPLHRAHPHRGELARHHRAADAPGLQLHARRHHLPVRHVHQPRRQRGDGASGARAHRLRRAGPRGVAARNRRTHRHEGIRATAPGGARRGGRRARADAA